MNKKILNIKISCLFDKATIHIKTNMNVNISPEMEFITFLNRYFKPKDFRRLLGYSYTKGVNFENVRHWVYNTPYTKKIAPDKRIYRKNMLPKMMEAIKTKIIELSREETNEN